jgi:hypothetical protein
MTYDDEVCDYCHNAVAEESRIHSTVICSKATVEEALQYIREYNKINKYGFDNCCGYNCCPNCYNIISTKSFIISVDEHEPSIIENDEEPGHVVFFIPPGASISFYKSKLYHFVNKPGDKRIVSVADSDDESDDEDDNE